MVISSRSLDVDGMSNHPILTEKFVVIAPADSGTPCREVSDLAGLSRVLPIVRFNQQSHLGEQVQRTLRRVGLNPPRRLEVDTADTLTSMVAGGLGWAITTPLCILQGARSAAQVRKDVIRDLNADRTIYLHARRGEYGALAGEVFAIVQQVLQSHVSQELKALSPALPPLIQRHDWRDDV